MDFNIYKYININFFYLNYSARRENVMYILIIGYQEDSKIYK